MFIFTPLFTIFVLLLGGYVAKLTGALKQRQSRAFLDFAIMFAIPCLIFNGIYHLEISGTFITLIFTGFLSCILAGILTIILGKILGFSKVTLISMFLLASFGNTLFVGIPIVSGIYDSTFVGKVILYDSLATGIPVSILAPFILSFTSAQKVSILGILKRIATFPPFIALTLGFLFKPIPLPDFIFAPMQFFGNCATAVALFAIGLGLGFNAIKSSYKSAIIVILAKTLLAPLIFIGILKIFQVEFTKDAIAAILESSMPTMTLIGAIIMKAKLDSNLAVSSIAFGILFSFISVPLLCAILL